MPLIVDADALMLRIICPVVPLEQVREKLCAILFMRISVENCPVVDCPLHVRVPSVALISAFFGLPCSKATEPENCPSKTRGCVEGASIFIAKPGLVVQPVPSASVIKRGAAM